MKFAYPIHFTIEPLSIFEGVPSIEKLTKEALEKAILDNPALFAMWMEDYYDDINITKTSKELEEESKRLILKGFDYIWSHMEIDKESLECTDNTDSYRIEYSVYLAFNNEKGEPT